MSEERYCDNPSCEAPAFQRVRVSVDRPGDEHRWYCYPCYEAYIVGVQHGRFMAGKGEATAFVR